MVRRRLAGAAVAVLVAGAGVAVGAAPAEAAPAVKVVKVLYNPPGNDLPITNTKLNTEYIVVKNVSSTTRTLTGWTVRDKQSHIYTLPTFSLGAGKSVTIRTGRGTRTATTLYWGSDAYIWNNSGTDAAILRNRAGTTVHTCSYTANSTGVKAC